MSFGRSGCRGGAGRAPCGCRLEVQLRPELRPGESAVRPSEANVQVTGWAGAGSNRRPSAFQWEVCPPSTGASNPAGEEFGEDFCWFSPVEDLTGSAVDLAGDGPQVVGVVGDVGAFG